MMCSGVRSSWATSAVMLRRCRSLRSNSSVMRLNERASCPNSPAPVSGDAHAEIAVGHGIGRGHDIGQRWHSGDRRARIPPMSTMGNNTSSHMPPSQIRSCQILAITAEDLGDDQASVAMPQEIKQRKEEKCPARKRRKKKRRFRLPTGRVANEGAADRSMILSPGSAVSAIW
jgi:hypothetical protein